MKSAGIISDKRAIVLIASLPLFGASIPAIAQDATAYGGSIEVPTFEQIDSNGVDLLTGKLRISSPVLSSGSQELPRAMGLQWNGTAWAHVDIPSIWLNGNNRWFVNYKGSSDEFSGFSSGQTQVKPITGAKLACSVELPSKRVFFCNYRSRQGDLVVFTGGAPGLYPNLGVSNYAFGNLGTGSVSIFSPSGNRVHDVNSIGRLNASSYLGSAQPSYNSTNVQLTLNGGQSLTLNTSNMTTSNASKHYLRPQSVTQVVTDEVGTRWRYVVNSNRYITQIQSPGGVANVNITYNNGRVTSVTNAAGTWNYSYTRPGNNFGTTTVTAPGSVVTYVEYNTDKGYATLLRDPLNRTTTYSYDTSGRMVSMTMPEGNNVVFTYDARGNVTQKTTNPKPGSSLAPLTEYAGYDATCTIDIKCNKPNYVIDAKGNRTDFEYDVGTQASVTMQFQVQPLYYYTGTGRPTKVTLPAPVAGQPRPEIRNVYSGGVLAETSECITQASCAGTADEVKTTYQYDTGRRLMLGKAITSNGVTLRTCYTYNDRGQLVSETEPKADLATCPTAILPSMTPATSMTSP
jgi:YD repeat-containing protein